MRRDGSGINVSRIRSGSPVQTHDFEGRNDVDHHRAQTMHAKSDVSPLSASLWCCKAEARSEPVADAQDVRFKG
jgi:hypothetical protein